jgi:hypothetical protein
MIKRIEYGYRWNDYRGAWATPYSERRARQHHVTRRIYTALIEQHDGSLVALELCFAGAYCNVYFLDDQKRCFMCYTFEPIDEDRLFLCSTGNAEYEGESRVSWRGISRSYDRDGRVKTFTSDPQGKPVVLYEEEPADVRFHYEPVPAFKEWESIIRRDRARPALRVIPGGT